MTTSVMGSLAWAERSSPNDRGQVTAREKGQLLLNMAWTGVVEGTDRLRGLFGSMVPVARELDDMIPPDTQLVRDSLALASSVQVEALTEHCWRTYFYGVLLGEFRGLTFDRSLLFSAAILHDIGLAKDRPVSPCDCCFAVAGAWRARQHLISCGHASDIADDVAEAISLHLNAYVSARWHGAVAHLVNRGAMCDVFGFGRQRVARLTRAKLVERHPVAGLADALEIRTTSHLRRSRAAFLSRFA